ncbi:hypothetical protein [Staphylococcus simulans]|uniref:hypothetical protein n=3 Tax=Staphylococcus simulans TaxID=1286 RepID=UPI000D1F3F2F|nr:hypothetical protein [Staphylococcus simulans]PTJ40544.1 hypothetical protein BU022_10705 [Staphylococcus simulans]
MKLVGEFNKPIEIAKQRLNVISFQNTSKLNALTEGLIKYSQSKSKNYDENVRLVADDYQTILPNKVNLIIVPCGDINLFDSKIFKEALYHRFEQQIFNEETTNLLYNKVESMIERFLNSLEIKNESYQVDFQSPNIVLKKLLGMFKPDFHNDLEDLNAIEQRKLFIDTLTSTEKENVLVLLFPEAHLGLSDMKAFKKYLQTLNMFSIIVTSHPYFIIESDTLALIKMNGEPVNTKQIREELLLFKEKEKITDLDKTSKMIAYHEFCQHPYLDDEFFIQFMNKY